MNELKNLPRRAAIKWGIAGGVIGLIVAIAIALSQKQGYEPGDADFKRGQRAAPFVMLIAGVSAAIGYWRAKRREPK